MRPLWEAIQDNDSEVLDRSKTMTATYALCDSLLKHLGLIPDVRAYNPATDSRNFLSPMYVKFKNEVVTRDEGTGNQGLEMSVIMSIIQGGAREVKRDLKKQGLTVNFTTNKGKESDNFSFDVSYRDTYICRFTFNASKNTAYLSIAQRRKIKTELYVVTSVFPHVINHSARIATEDIYQYLIDHAEKVIRK